MLELKVMEKTPEGMVEHVLTFEHSLLALSKWEAKTKKAFLSRTEKTASDMLSYYQCMITSPEQDVNLVYRLSPAQLEMLTKYINDPSSASTAPSDPKAKNTGQINTSEFIYYQMVALRIPFEAQTWHINRLMMLIAITADAQKPPEKQTKAEKLTRWQEINERNRKFFKSEG